MVILIDPALMVPPGLLTAHVTTPFEKATDRRDHGDRNTVSQEAQKTGWNAWAEEREKEREGKKDD